MLIRPIIPEEYNLDQLAIKMEDKKLKGIYSVEKNIYVIEPIYKDIKYNSTESYFECIKPNKLIDIYNPYCKLIINDVEFFRFIVLDSSYTKDFFCFIFMKDKKIGFLRRNFENIIQIDKQIKFNEGLAPVSVGRKWGYINENGEFKISPNFMWAKEFKNGVAEVVPLYPKCGYTSCCALIDKSGEIVQEQQCKCSLPDSKGKWYL